jgi:hypothetical protein
MSKAIEAATEQEWVELPHGKYRRDPNNLQYGWVFCYDCAEPREARYVFVPFESRKAFSNFTGRCAACARSNKRKRSGIDTREIITRRGTKSIVLNWDKRDPTNDSKVSFRCWYCEQEHYAWMTVAESLDWDGLNKACRRQYFLDGLLDEVQLSGGAKYRRDPTNPKYGWVTCPVSGPGCEGERYVSGVTNNITGRCKTCSYALRRKHTGVIAHPSGAHVLYDERDPGHRYRRAFICANPTNNPRCLGKSFAYTWDFRNPRWHGLCRECLSARPNPQKITANRTQENGTEVFYSEEEGGQVPILYAECKHTRKVKRHYSVANFGRFAVRCRSCFYDPTALAERIAAEKIAAITFQSQNNGEEKLSGKNKKKPGPEKGHNAKITEEKIREALKSLGRFAPQEELASKIGVDPRSLRDWHKTRGLSYKQLRQQFTAPEVVG